MHKQLSRGQFYGQVTRQRVVGGLHLVETRYSPRTFLPRHSHEHAYFCLVRRGHYLEEYGSHSRACGPMTVAFHPAGELHSEQFAADETWSFNIELTSTWLAQWQNAAGRIDWTADFRGGAVACLAQRLYAEFSHTDAAAALAIEGLTLEIMAEAWRGSLKGQKRTAPPWLAGVQKTLRVRFAEGVTLDELAELARVHPVHVAAAFRRHFGCTVGQYVRGQRVEFACRQLGNSRATLAEIGLAAGFSDQSHFCRIFKRLTGLTPAAYRRSLGRP
jgi:AraC-like DNA-binding protein